jgi:hypothetical protein
MKLKSLAVISAVAFMSVPVFADDDLEEAYQAGYKDWKRTTVKGDFTGCSVGKTIQFTNGLSFVCEENEAAENADKQVLILKHPKTKAYKVFIGGEDYDGHLHGVK